MTAEFSSTFGLGWRGDDGDTRTRIADQGQSLDELRNLVVPAKAGTHFDLLQLQQNGSRLSPTAVRGKSIARMEGGDSSRCSDSRLSCRLAQSILNLPRQIGAQEATI